MDMPTQGAVMGLESLAELPRVMLMALRNLQHPGNIWPNTGFARFSQRLLARTLARHMAAISLLKAVTVSRLLIFVQRDPTECGLAASWLKPKSFKSCAILQERAMRSIMAIMRSQSQVFMQ